MPLFREIPLIHPSQSIFQRSHPKDDLQGWWLLRWSVEFSALDFQTNTYLWHFGRYMVYPLVISHNYGKSLFRVELSIKHSDFRWSWPEGDPDNRTAGCSVTVRICIKVGTLKTSTKKPKIFRSQPWDPAHIAFEYPAPADTTCWTGEGSGNFSQWLAQGLPCCPAALQIWKTTFVLCAAEVFRGRP